MKKEVLFILLVLIVLTSILGISYASWLFTGKQKDFNTLGSKCFELTMINESEGITFDKAYPISDEEGLSTTGYTFTIKNTCNTYATYEVNLEDMLVEEKRLSGEYIKVSINDGTPMNLKELEEKEAHIEESDKSYELTSGSLGPEEEKTYTIKLWMDESTPAIEETMNATFLSKISIEAGYTPEENLENEITLQAKSITESLNNKSEVFEITGTSTNYNLIEYSLDKSHWSRIESPSKNVTITQEFTEEGKHAFYIRDEVGNIKEIEIQTTKLDKTVPEIKIEETDNQENVELHITFTDNEELGGYAITESSEEPTEWTSIEGKETTIEYTLTENTTYYIWVKDSVGNISYQKYSTDTIDTQAPELTITNTLTDWGVKDTITIKATDDVVGISGISISKVEETYNWEFVENTLSYETTKEVTENGTYYILVRDAYGHITTKSIVIDKIDDILPTIENLQTSTEWEKTNQITGSLKDPESGLSGYQITKEKIEPEEYIEINGTSYELNYEVSENGTYYIWVKDSVGNVYQTEVEVTKVDNTAPVLSNITNSSNGSWAQSITLSWDIEESGSGIKSVEWRLNDDLTWGSFGQNEWYGITRTNERNDTIYIRVTDNAGNVSNIESTVLKIDRTVPSAPVITNSKNNVWSKDAVTVNMESTDSRSGIARYEWYENGSWTTRAISISDGIGSITYTNQRNETIRIRAVDNAGNVSSESTTIVKLDTTNPTAKISASVSGNNIRVSASGSSDTNSGIKNYQYSRDNSTWYTSTSDSYTFTGLVDGSYTVYVKVTDNSGRTSSVVSTTTVVAYTNVYVSSSGNDSSGNGSSSKPYATLAKAYSQVKSGGNILLLSNITASSTANFNTASKSVTLKSNGSSVYTITRASSLTGGGILSISNKNNVTISNITFNGNNVSSTSALVSASGSSTLNLNSGTTVQNAVNTKEYAGGGVNVTESSTINVNGATIKNNKSANQGAGLYISGSTLVMNSGTITGNSTTGNGEGGAVILWQSTATIKAGTISNNTANANGGAIFSGCQTANTTLNISGGTFSGNKTNGGGGAIVVRSDNKSTCTATVNVTGGNFTSNSGSYGGAIALTRATGNFSNVTFSNNTVTYRGGAINVDESSLAYFKTGANFTGNTAPAAGAIHVSNSSTMHFQGASVSNNKATSESGGAIVVFRSNGNISSGTINGNTAKQFGGGVFYTDNSTGTISGGTISGNTAQWGGGVSVWGSSAFYFKGGTIQNNTANSNAGGIDVNNSALYMQGGNVLNNKCNTANQYGGIFVTDNSTYSYTSGNISGNTPLNSNK